MTHPRRGLYEALLTQALEQQLHELPTQLVAERSSLRSAEAADRVALHVSRLLKRVVESLEPRERVESSVQIARRLVEVLASLPSQADVLQDTPLESAQVLRAVAARLPTGSAETVSEPLIPLLDTTLLTNAPGEPRVGTQVLAEVHSADRIDVVMAFIRRSGIRPLLDVLRAHCEAGRALRVLTTTYTGSTEAAALDQLRALGAEVRVSYDTSTTRLHAKAWLFHRASGFSTAYIGSSNLTHSAQVSGLEWNLRVSGARNPDVVDKVAAVFESYWHSGDFEPYVAEEFAARTQVVSRGAELQLSPLEVRLEPFQESLLEQIAVAREAGHHRNLLVSATGTGKTVMAAVDYARLRDSLPRARLLFVAHREEILQQSRATFRQVLRDHSFGELWTGREKPQQFEHVFASVQSLHTGALESLPAEQFDVVVVDEFHHAAAPTYRALLEHLQPRELLGLTATPERGDGLSILPWFEGRIAAELRVWDAIDQHRLTPFAYFGIHDGMDLREVPWRRGRGYDVAGLSQLYTANDVWARLVLKHLAAHVDDVQRVRALGFCVSVEHAQFMARVFSASGVASVAVWAESGTEARRQALADLAAGRVQVVFSVDLFNEGVDIPTVDTVLMLRPTDSGTLFLQQLGRGLRRSPGKTLCTVLDFVGQHRREFRHDRRLRALLGGSRSELIQQIEQGFPFLPAGCHLHLDRVALELVLRNVREAVPAMWNAKVNELRELCGAERPRPTLSEYLEATGIEPSDLYQGGRSWSELCSAAEVALGVEGPHDKTLRAAVGRLLHIDDATRIVGYRALLSVPQPPELAACSELQRRLLRMLVASLLDRAVPKGTSLEEGCALLWQHPAVRLEILELLTVLEPRIAHLHRPLASHPDSPLRTHAHYTRIEILAALGIGEGAKVAPWQSGVYWAKPAKADLFAFTLDKSEGGFSPTTRYRDFAISRELIHWESQSITRAASDTGLRYQHHAVRGSEVLLFARRTTSERAFCCLGTAQYVSHEGECPMAITWRLDTALPGDVFAQYAAAVA